MKNKTIFLILSAVLLLSVSSFGGNFDLGVDVFSRFVWRGTDIGNSVSVQPALAYHFGGVEIGVWASYPVASDITSLGSNENDLYITYSLDNIGLAVTDYYFPEGGEWFHYEKDEIHSLEASLSCAMGPVALLACYFFSGDPDRSFYAEVAYDFYEKEGIRARLFIGGGNGMYVIEKSFHVVNVGLSVSKGPVSIAYILNPDAETTFLVAGYSI